MFPTRRDLLLGVTTTAAAGLAWSNRRRRALAAEAPPETTRVTIARGPSLCIMPQYVVDELLADEGITRIDYSSPISGPLLSEAIASGQLDFAMTFSGPLVLELDRGKRITMLAGVHVGCFELFTREGINSVADLKGKSVGPKDLGRAPMSSFRRWRRWSGSIRPKTSTG